MGRCGFDSRREYQRRDPCKGKGAPLVFNRGGPAAQGAAIRPDAVGTRAQPEVFPPGAPLWPQDIVVFFFSTTIFRQDFPKLV